MIVNIDAGQPITINGQPCTITESGANTAGTGSRYAPEYGSLSFTALADDESGTEYTVTLTGGSLDPFLLQPLANMISQANQKH